MGFEFIEGGNVNWSKYKHKTSKDNLQLLCLFSLKVEVNDTYTTLNILKTVKFYGGGSPRVVVTPSLIETFHLRPDSQKVNRIIQYR